MDAFIIRSLGDAFEIAGWAALLGGVSGLVSSLTRPPFGRKKAAFGFDNRIRWPKFRKGAKDPETGKQRWINLDAGSLGPTVVGAVAAIFVVFAAGVNPEEIAKAGGGTEVLDAVSYVELFVLAIAGGAAGEIVFRSLAGGSKIPKGALEAVEASAEAAEAAAPGTAEEKAAVANRARGAGLRALDTEEKESE